MLITPVTPLQVICIMGPTAIGKTSLAIELYQQGLPIDIISVDSAMVYNGLNIGTGKPSNELLAKIPHGLVNIREPYEVYTVADFYKDVIELIRHSHSNNRLPCLVGGTMMYYNALFKGLSKLPSSEPGIRAQIYQDIDTRGLEEVYKTLVEIDAATAKRINPNDTQRIIRALEVYFIAGRPLSVLLAENTDAFNEFNKFNIINFIMAPEDSAIRSYKSYKTNSAGLNSRLKLHEAIATRFHDMLDQGLITEVKNLYNNPLIIPTLPAMKSCGYQQITQYLAGDIKYEAMIENSISATRQLAKRQLTWLRHGFKHWKNSYWLNIFEKNIKAEIINLLKF